MTNSKKDLLDINQLMQRGWGSRMTIYRRVARGELPNPVTFGDAHNSKKFWFRSEIEQIELARWKRSRPQLEELSCKSMIPNS